MGTTSSCLLVGRVKKVENQASLMGFGLDFHAFSLSSITALPG
jgi:hypothetical protein